MELVPDGQLSAQKKLLPNPGLGIILLFFCWFEGRKHLASMHRIPAGLDMFGVQTYMDVRNYTHGPRKCGIVRNLRPWCCSGSRARTEFGKYFRRNIFTSQLNTRSQETQKYFYRNIFWVSCDSSGGHRVPCRFWSQFCHFCQINWRIRPFSVNFA